MGKIINRWYIKTMWILISLAATQCGHTQDTTVNKYGLWVIGIYSSYGATVKNDAGKRMVDLKKAIPGLAFDLRYAGKNNFTQTKLYPKLKTTYLRKPVALALAAVHSELKKQGLALQIFDAYRPYSITEKMWELVKDDRYAANPKNGSGHNRGIAVDLTIINLHTKDELDMGTDFDNFTDAAHHNFTALPPQILQNRLLLKTLMEKNGFKALETEWWHYSFANGAAYELLDVSFNELRKGRL